MNVPDSGSIQNLKHHFSSLVAGAKCLSHIWHDLLPVPWHSASDVGNRMVCHLLSRCQSLAARIGKSGNHPFSDCRFNILNDLAAVDCRVTLCCFSNHHVEILFDSFAPQSRSIFFLLFIASIWSDGPLPDSYSNCARLRITRHSD